MKRRSFIKQTTIGAAAFTGFKRSNSFENLPERLSETNLSELSAADEMVRIAVVQQEANTGEIEANRKKALDFAEKALAQKADVILFHEGLLIGYHKDIKKLAEPVDGITTKAFQRLLKGTKSLVIYGLAEKDKDNYYISAPVVSATGVIANYHKTHLWWNAEGVRHEPTYYSPGNKLVTFRIKGHLCGIMICYDGKFPEMTRSYANMGCSILFWMNNRPSSGHDEVKVLARQNSIIMAASNYSGKNEAGNQGRGGSNITGPKGELIAEIWDKEGLIVGDVYPNQVQQIRKNNPWYTGLRPDLYYYK
jgi:predicted amidohydrolase